MLTKMETASAITTSRAKQQAREEEFLRTNAAGTSLMRTETASAIIGEQGKENHIAEGAIDKQGLDAMRSDQEVNRAIERYSDMIRRLCLIHLKNDADTEDIFQTVFLKYALSSVAFENEEHMKRHGSYASLLTPAKICSKAFFTVVPCRWMKFWNSLTDMPEDHREVLEAVLALPQKYREVVYLHYYEGYTVTENRGRS